MTVQLGEAVRNARLDALEDEVGTSAIMEIRSGAQPANCAAADSGNLLASLPLPSDWMGDASGGSKAKLGTWEDTTANAAGTAGHFRIKDSGGTITHMQGSVTITGGGGDLTLDNNVLAIGQDVVIASFVLIDGNA